MDEFGCLGGGIRVRNRFHGIGTVHRQPLNIP